MVAFKVFPIVLENSSDQLDCTNNNANTSNVDIFLLDFIISYSIRPDLRCYMGDFL